jgi:type IV pilus assembly protein PilV
VFDVDSFRVARERTCNERRKLGNGSSCYHAKTLDIHFSSTLVPHCAPHRYRGFTLVEIVVALLIIAIAAIGIAALYLDTTETARGSEPRARAAELADEIAARIKANAAGRTGYASVVGVVCDQKAKPKRAEDAAAIEAACWHERVSTELPSGMGAVTRDTSTTPPTYVVAVSWSPAEGGAASFVIRVSGTDEE